MTTTTLPSETSQDQSACPYDQQDVGFSYLLSISLFFSMKCFVHSSHPPTRQMTAGSPLPEAESIDNRVDSGWLVRVCHQALFERMTIRHHKQY